jgi:hypothetical protein
MRIILYILLFAVFFGVQLTAQEVELEVEGGIKIGRHKTPYTLTKSDAGMIQWNALNSDFEGWNGIDWRSLTTGVIIGNDNNFSSYSPLDDRIIKGPLWSIDGNSQSALYLTPPRLGTRDTLPVVFISNNVERMRIKEDGNISIDQNLKIDSNLVVKQNVDLNTVGGETQNNGPFWVLNQQPTFLSGKLTVDHSTQMNLGVRVKGPTILDGSFKVDKDYFSIFTGLTHISDMTQSDSASFTTGALVVDGGLGIGKNINIGGNLFLGGTAAFGGPVVFASPVTIKADNESTAFNIGALIVAGGVGIGQRLNVDGVSEIFSSLDVTLATNLDDSLAVNGITNMKSSLEVERETDFKNELVVLGSTDLNKTLNVKGASTFKGSLGVSKATVIDNTLEVSENAFLMRDMNISNTASLNNTLIVNGVTTLRNNLNVQGDATFQKKVEIKSNIPSTEIGIGALSVIGGAKIDGNLYTGGKAQFNNDLYINGESILNNELHVSHNGEYVASFENSGSNNGINILLNSEAVDKNNKYISFLNSSNNIRGSIQGQTLANLSSDPVYLRQLKLYDAVISSYETQVITSSVETVLAAGFLAAASTSSTICTGFGACVSVPIPSFIAQGISYVALAATKALTLGAALNSANAVKNEFISDTRNNIGVSYQSGGADYAEWLPKKNKNDQYEAGSVVGIKNGKISLTTNNSDKVLAISTNPIIIGNMPADVYEHEYEKVAFLGQVPIIVMGKVRVGDYIIPSGANDGTAISIAPHSITAKEFSQIIGMAWSGSSKEGKKMINVAVGLNDSDIGKLMIRQLNELTEVYKQIQNCQSEVQDIRNDIAQADRVLESLVLGFSGSDSDPGENEHFNTSESHASESNPHQWFKIENRDPSTITYNKVTRDQIEEGITMAEQLFKNNGGDIDTNPFWRKVSSDKAFKETFVKKIETSLENTFHTHKKIDHDYEIKR